MFEQSVTAIPFWGGTVRVTVKPPAEREMKERLKVKNVLPFWGGDTHIF
jgi:hypothetical protein